MSSGREIAGTVALSRLEAVRARESGDRRPAGRDPRPDPGASGSEVLARGVPRVSWQQSLPRLTFLKRPLDCVLAFVGVVLSAPLWLIVAVAIKLEDGGPVLYTQERWGRYGTKFRAYKFRSMVASSSQVEGSVQARRGDPRVTRVGRLMRKAALDELPQILNILRGDMSLVGPRALPVNEKQQNDRYAHLTDDQVPGFAVRSLVRPGLTGLAQLFASRDVDRRLKFRYDAIYVRRQNLFLDLGLILRSLVISVAGRWEQYHRAVDARLDTPRSSR